MHLPETADNSKLPLPHAHDTSNFHQEPRSQFLPPSINLAESYNCNVLTATTWSIPLWITSAFKPIARGKHTPCFNKSVKVDWKRRKAERFSQWLITTNTCIKGLATKNYGSNEAVTNLMFPADSLTT